MPSFATPFFSFRRIATLGALLFAMLWVPLTTHELLESTGWIHHDADGRDHDHGPSHEAADGDYRVHAAKVLVKGPNLVALGYSAAPVELDNARLFFQAQVALRLRPATESPPELVRTWQFEFRLALPSRAPSFAV